MSQLQQLDETTGYGVASETETRPLSRASRRAAVCAAAGTVIEYYEFGVYAYMSVVIGPIFFPGSSASASVLAALAVFGSAFLMRPIGGLVLGYLGDRLGRRTVLVATVIGMGSATGAVGLLPTPAEAGLVAPLLLVLVRLAQGFFAGGEVTGAAAYVAESAPAGRRGFYGAFTPMGVSIGSALAAVTCGAINGLLDAHQLHAWGWRLPFMAAVPLVLVAVLLRRQLDESVAFRRAATRGAVAKAPLSELLREHRVSLARVTVLAFGLNASYWVGLVFMNVYLTSYLHYERSAVYWMMACITLAMAVLMPFCGGLSDRVGRRKALAVGFVGYAVLTVPAMIAMSSSFGWAVLAMTVAALPLPLVQSVAYPSFAEQFPTSVRYSGMALSFNLGSIIGGGLTPWLAMTLIDRTGNLLMPGFVLIGAALVSLLALAGMRETAHRSLD